MRKYSIVITIILCVCSYLLFNSGQENVPTEKIDIASGISFDLIKNDVSTDYLICSNVYTFNKKDEIASIILPGRSPNIPDSRAARKQISNKKFLLGLQKVFIISEDVATSSINPIFDMNFSHQESNDSTWLVICKNKALDILKYKVGDYPSSSDYINGMIESAREQNFMSNNYKVLDMFVRVGSEGRNLVLPYIEISDENIKLTGMAVFNKDKMKTFIPMEEAKYMNFLRENNVHGTFTLQSDSAHWVSSYGKMQRKVKCKRENNKYKFIIDLKFNGQLINNTKYTDLMENAKTREEYIKDLEADIQKKSYMFIYNMQKKYKTDCLELGRDAAATFGRNKGYDWDKIVCNANFEINVKVNIVNFGRGHI